jgi:hypothetical protein
VEPPDLLCVRNRGDLAPDELRIMLDEGRRLAAAQGPILWLSDLSELGNVYPATRKLVGTGDVLSLVRAAALVGAGFTQRIMTTLVLNAARLAHRGAAAPPVRLFATEAEGRAWLDSFRRPPGGWSSGP